jgi:DNA replication and repair protein RecF
VHVSRVALHDFRNYRDATVDLSPGVTLLHGPVGAGKTNLLEALYFGCVGRSCRTSNERELVRFGAGATYVCVTGANSSVEHTFEVGLEPGRSKSIKIDGAHWHGPGESEHRPILCVFMPDRLELVKGSAGVRRAHLDALVAALWPTRRATRLSYGQALAQRNALLARVRNGASPDSLTGWTRELARHGVELMRDRAAAVELVSPAFAGHICELGLDDGGSVEYRPRSHASAPDELERELHDGLDHDLSRGFTTHGPHRDDLRFETAGRDLRRFGSQGQQRIALLALLLSERDALRGVRGDMPILLLDDVLSELDPTRRERLLEVLATGGQTLITTADPGSALNDRDDIAKLRVTGGTLDG